MYGKKKIACSFTSIFVVHIHHIQKWRTPAGSLGRVHESEASAAPLETKTKPSMEEKAITITKSQKQTLFQTKLSSVIIKMVTSAYISWD